MTLLLRFLFILCFVLIVSWAANSSLAQQVALPRVIVDADTANEIDDHYAIVRMLNQDKFKVLGLTSAQWIHYLGEADSVEASQRENEALLKLLGKEDLPNFLGSKEPMGKPWGGTDAKDSAAAQFIIAQAKRLPPGEKLIVVCTGASTNLASAIKLQPKIASQIKLYLLGFQYDFESGVWNKSEFNIRRDLNAADFVLDQKDLEVHVMPVSVAKQLTFSRQKTFSRNEKLGELGAYLTKRWQDHASGQDTRIIWDLALVEALIRPELAKQVQVSGPPENTARKVWMYSQIDADAMRSDFWKTTLGKFSK